MKHEKMVEVVDANGAARGHGGAALKGGGGQGYRKIVEDRDLGRGKSRGDGDGWD